MPFRLICCRCSAAEAVVEGRPPSEARPRAREAPPFPLERKLSARSASSSVVSSSLAYFDASQNEEEGINLFHKEAIELEFFDAQESLAGKGSTVITIEDEEEVITSETVMIDGSSGSRSPGTLDEYLLAPAYRTTRHRRRPSSLRKSDEWGFPGSLTTDQLKAYQRFREELHRRGGVYTEMVYNYKGLEPEPYALCRYLRYCNFHVDRIFAYMDQHTNRWNAAKGHDFYPNIYEAVGAPLSVLLTQFPSLYMGYAKDGYPCCYFDSGGLSLEGVECVTDLERIPNYIWNTMMWEMKKKWEKAQAKHPGFVRLEQLTIMNLEGLSASLFTPRLYSSLQEVDAVAQAFPEMLHTLVIINAPSFFNFVWNIIKRFLDANTTKRIEIYSSPAKGQQRLLELIDQSELPSDYGGRALSTSEMILREGRTGKVPRYQIVELVNIRKRRTSSFDFTLKHDERVAISVYTRSETCVDFTLFDANDVQIAEKRVKAKEKLPFSVRFGEARGPGTYTMVAKTEEPASSQHFLVIGEVFEAQPSGTESVLGNGGMPEKSKRPLSPVEENADGR